VARVTAERSSLVLPLVVALVTAAVFASSIGHGFVWDDQFNIVDNPHYRGLGPTQLQWMLTAIWGDHPGRGGQWIPVTWASFGLDYVVWGSNAAGYHLTNVALHAANAALFYWVASLLLASAAPHATPITIRLGAAVAALFFGIHPLRVESVAWVTERRDVLSGLFFLLAVLAYLKATRRSGRAYGGWLAASIAAYALGLASKPIVLTLPFVLLVLDAYPLGRLRGAWRSRLVEKVPYLALSAAAAALTLYAGHVAATLNPLARHALDARIAMAFWSIARYVRTTVLPLGLSPLYEAPDRVDVWSPPYLTSALSILVITAALVVARRQWPAGLAAWVIYLLLLAPVSGVIPIGPQQGADRYTYLPSLSVSVLIGGAVIAVVRARGGGLLAPRYARLALGGIVVWLGGFAALASAHTAVWRDHETLWQWSVDVDPDCGICHGNLGEAFRLGGRLEPAIAHLSHAIALRPHQTIFRRDLGFALLQAGRVPEAVTVLRDVVTRMPRDVDVQNFTGLALMHDGRHEEALGHFRAAIALAPARADLHVNVAAAFASVGRNDAARQHAERALALDPGQSQARALLEAVSARRGRSLSPNRR
jgi:hypothetical protein